MSDLREYRKIKYMGDCKCGNCQLVPDTVLSEHIVTHDALLAFFKWAMREGPWDGGDLDGASVQDKAESLGLIVKTQYDAEKHGVQSDFETGDDWFEYAPAILGLVRRGVPRA